MASERSAIESLVDEVDHSAERLRSHSIQSSHQVPFCSLADDSQASGSFGLRLAIRKLAFSLPGGFTIAAM
jgi:hypothetical protein